MTKVVPHLLVYLSGHGFGHVAQVAPVLNHMRKQCPEFQLSICSVVPLALLRCCIEGEFSHISHAADFGMVMASALDVLPAESMALYSKFHLDWDVRLQQEIELISGLGPNFVLTNVAYLPLVAANRLQIPSAAMCSLNWADIFINYCREMTGAENILQQMNQAYAHAEDFLRITPAMPMHNLSNLKTIGPIARLGRDRQNEIKASLNLSDERLVLVSMGGIAMRLPMERWPYMDGIKWLVQQDWQIQRHDVIAIESLPMDFTDILASVDALLCKPGYGSFAEAACNGIPVLYVTRDDWPEEPCLIAWLEVHGLCRRIQRSALEQGGFEPTLQELLLQPKPEAVTPSGINQASSYLLERLL